MTRTYCVRRGCKAKYLICVDNFPEFWRAIGQSQGHAKIYTNLNTCSSCGDYKPPHQDHALGWSCRWLPDWASSVRRIAAAKITSTAPTPTNSLRSSFSSSLPTRGLPKALARHRHVSGSGSHHPQETLLGRGHWDFEVSRVPKEQDS